MYKKISIVIPIYNCEKYLEKCLNSIISQTYKNIEIILINDGSTDNTSIICEKYKEKDQRIKYFSKNNTGVSDTRNYGLSKVTGDYIMFVDSDDYIGESYIEDMYKKMKKNNVDIVVSGFTQVDENGKELKKSYFKTNKKVLKFDEYIDAFINYAYFTCVKMLFSKNVLKNNKFETKIRYGEDSLFAFEMLKNNSMHYLSNCEYYYVQNSSSLTHNDTIKGVNKYMEDTRYMLNRIITEFPQKEDLANVRMLTKLNIASLKLIDNPIIRYASFKKFVSLQKKKIDCKRINIKKINYVSKVTKLRLYMIKYNLYKMYYLFNKITQKIKRFKAK